MFKTLQLLHNTVTGERSLSVDGEDVPGTAGSTSYFTKGGSSTLIFSLGGVQGTVTIAYSGASVLYKCSWNGQDIPEENNLVGGSASRQADESMSRLKIELTGFEIGADENGAPLVLFKLHTIRENDLRETTVHRRFRDFHLLNEALKAAYRGNSLLGSFPALPPRGIKLLSDHLAPDFINKRQWQLNDYLHKMAHVPRIRTNPDWLTFLGLIDQVRETSALFPGGALGLALRGLQGGKGVEVTGITKLPDGTTSPAVGAGVKPGDRVSKINGDDCLSDGYDLVVAKLKAAHRPVLVHFLGEVPPRPEEGAAAAAVKMNGSAAASVSGGSPSLQQPTTGSTAVTSASALGLL